MSSNNEEINDQENNMGQLAADRESIIVRTSFVGIGANVLLAAFKALLGILSHSIAMVLDGVNNLSDALSSVITIVGTKLAGKAPDKKHPLGHGRVEYLTSMLVAGLVLYAGITSLVESVKKILHPETPDYGVPALVFMAAAIVVKLLLGRYVKSRGEMVNSGALIASGSDAAFDAILSASVLATALIYVMFGISLEALVGTVIAIVIVKAGIELFRETLDEILGKRADAETTGKILRTLREMPQVLGAYDLFLYNYGPNRNYGSVHLSLPDTMSVEEVDRLSRACEIKVYRETGVILTGIGVYSYNTGSGEAVEMRNAIQKQVLSHDWALQMHGFYVDLEKKTTRMDVVMSFDIEQKEGVRILQEEIGQMYPDFTHTILPDVDISDIE